MLFLYLRIGAEGFALATDRVVEVVPLVALKKMRRAPEGVVGSFEYRGRFVPVVDLCALELDRPAEQRLSTRIIIVRLPGADDALAGLIAESATETLRLDPEAFAPFASTRRGLVQRLDLESVLPCELRAFLAHSLVEC